MQDSLVNPVLPNLNYDNIAALQQKRTLAFVNHFLITTVQFLNNFAKQCEEKLMHFENKLEKINATMILLETRLSSIPEISTEQVKIIDEGIKTQNTVPHSETPITEPHSGTPITVEEVANSPSQLKPEYMRFIKMVQVGVPLQAVKLKLSLEGLDPNELDMMLKY
ncbi:unnamed protein product [Leptosia nina]|uniref:WASH complex subunit 3 n=1 Tax=Leptosia nina TaxID=320188 RepID=A0AAV1IUI0_9NEOP